MFQPVSKGGGLFGNPTEHTLTTAQSQQRKRGFMLNQRAWEQLLKDHKNRLHKAKPAVVIEPPWGCQGGAAPSTEDGESSRRRQRSPRRTAADQPKTPRPPSAGTQGRPPPKSGRPSSAKQCLPNGALTAAPSVRLPAANPLHGLSREQRRVCADIIDLLTTVDTKQCKLIVEHLFLAAEERKLLDGYNGAFPSMTYEGDRFNDE